MPKKSMSQQTPKPCDICPFTQTTKSIEKWGKDNCNTIFHCAEELHREGQRQPHPCFKAAKDIILKPCDPDHVPCFGHMIWIQERLAIDTRKDGVNDSFIMENNMSDKEIPVIIYTTAPKDYDWGWTQEVALDHSEFGPASSDHKKMLRKVEVADKYHANMQYGRYQSGNHIALYEDQYDRERQANYIHPCQNPKLFFRAKLTLHNDLVDNPEFMAVYHIFTERVTGLENATYKTHFNSDDFDVNLQVFNDKSLFDELCGLLQKWA